MRLINTETLDLEEFEYPDVPPYAILSHTWTQNEISYADLSALRIPLGKEEAYAKVQKTCERARNIGIEYCWVDTCCIDKSNHSELSEAINSMYNWYKEAKVCYVYLADVASGKLSEERGAAFASSRWFGRGWTLQELLAPESVVFLDSDWKRFGTKRDLDTTISNITGIPLRYLRERHDIQNASIAQRMSWVSGRKTKKAEDRVYCLLGIFGINMPLLYGEREAAAFKRLQLEILKDSDDTSIFAWACDAEHEGISNSESTQRDEIQEKESSHTANPPTHRTYGLLARTPDCFLNSKEIERADLPKAEDYRTGIRTPTVYNNKGLRICLPSRRLNDRQLKIVLGCKLPLGLYVTLYLQDVSANGGRYVRIDAASMDSGYSAEQIKSKCKYRNITTETRAFNRVSMVLSQDHVKSQGPSEVGAYNRPSREEYDSSFPGRVIPSAPVRTWYNIRPGPIKNHMNISANHSGIAETAICDSIRERMSPLDG